MSRIFSQHYFGSKMEDKHPISKRTAAASPSLRASALPAESAHSKARHHISFTR
jgi:hypothetical protein